MKTVSVDRKSKTITVAGDYWSVMIHNGKIISKTGNLSPVEMKQVKKRYYATFSKES